MYLTPTAQDNIAAQIANHIHLNSNDYKAVATRVGRAGHPEAAVVAITRTGKTDCTAKVAVHHSRLAYMSATGTHISYPTRWSDSGRIILSLLTAEHH